MNDFMISAQPANLAFRDVYLTQVDSSVTGYGWTLSQEQAMRLTREQADILHANLCTLLDPDWTELLRSAFPKDGNRGKGQLAIVQLSTTVVTAVDVGTF